MKCLGDNSSVLNPEGEIQEVNFSREVADFPGQDAKVVQICLVGFPFICVIAYSDPNDVINKTSVIKQVVAMLRLDAFHLMAGEIDGGEHDC